MTLPNGHTGHAWIIYGYGSSSGEVSGEFEILVEGYDSTGVLLSQNRTSSQILAENWNSRTLRFRPHENVTSFRIVVEVTPLGANADGSLYIDTLNLRSIRPHNGWVDGSIAETAVSTGGRSFAWGTGYGQSLVADLLEDGVSGLKGYVYEPYLTAVGYPSVLMESYVQGYNLAESHAAANLITGWMGVVVGDPKMAPFADQFHDVNIIDARLLGFANQNENSTVEIALENTGMSSAVGSIVVVNLQGNVLLNQTNLTIPAGDKNGSRFKIELDFPVSSLDWMNIRIRWLNSTPERNFKQNIVDLGFPINAQPVVRGGYCSASELARGSYTICNILASDDVNVTSVVVQWRVGSSGEWVTQNATYLFGERWETVVTIPTTSILGNLSLRATAYDSNGLFDYQEFPNVTRILNASQSWYGPFIEGLDPSNWDRASTLPISPSFEIERSQTYVLIVCAEDADFEPEYEFPTLVANRGNLSELIEIESSEFGVYCYEASFELARSSSLEQIEFSLFNSNMARVTYREIQVGDIAPSIQLTIESENGTLLDRIINNGREYLRIQVSDVDDDEFSFIGDLRMLWPGGEILQVPIDIGQGTYEIIIQLDQVQHALESGNFWTQVSGTGLHGSTATVEIEYPVILTPPKIQYTSLCGVSGKVESMNFGQIATWTVVIESDRPIETSSVSLIQEGWAVSLPTQDEPVWLDNQNATLDCDRTITNVDQTKIYYRVRLDSTFIEGEGQLLAYLKDVDGLVHSIQQSIEFTRAPTILETELPQNISTGVDLTAKLIVSDDDGLSGIICSLQILDQEQNVLSQFIELAGESTMSSNEIMWVYPIPRNVENQSISLQFECINEQFESFNATQIVTIDPYVDPCFGSNSSDCTANGNSSQTSNEVDPSYIGIFALILVCVLALSALLISRNRKVGQQWAIDNEGNIELSHHVEIDDLFDQNVTNIASTSEEVPDFLPSGWTIEQFSSWLEGPAPEDWSNEQWATYVAEHQQKLFDFNSKLEKN